MFQRAWPVLWRCLLGIFLGIVASIGQRELREGGVVSLLLLPYPAVFLAVVMGGLLCGLVALAATAFGLAYFTLETFGPVHHAAQRDALDLTLFCAISLVLAFTIDRQMKALRDARAVAEEASAAKDAMIAVVAHDLRNPLQTVALSTELLASKLPSDAHAEGLLDRTRRSIDRACRLVDTVLDQAQQGRDVLRVRKVSCGLADIVDESLKPFEPIAAARSISLQRPAEKELEGTVSCDRERLIQILMNVLGNAMKFTPAGGIVGLDARRDHGVVRFTVSDTGCGMKPDELAHCFERLWHGDTPGHGTGLGLWIAKTLVEAHGGRIAAASEFGRGTRVSIALPIERPQPAPPEPAGPLAEARA